MKQIQQKLMGKQNSKWKNVTTKSFFFLSTYQIKM